MILCGNHKRERGTAMKNRRSPRSWMIEENPDTTIKEVIQMKRREGLRSWMYAILIALAVMGMSLLLSQVPAQAAVSCANVSSTSKTDTDGDGFTDYDECRGITFAGGGTFPGKNSANRPSDRSQYLDPDTKDLFVILVRKTPTSLMPAKPTNAEDVAYWFEYIIHPVGQSTGQFGLGFAVHEIPATQAPNRTVCSTTGCQTPTGQTVKQKAVKISESLDQTADNILGYTSSCGTPNGPDLTTIYTQKIYNLLSRINQLSQLDLYIKHTIAHEIGHTVGPLAPVNDPNYGAYHYQSADNHLIMDQSVYQSGGNVYIGTQYTAGDQAGVHLK
jgi:hypothetical protein